MMKNNGGIRMALFIVLVFLSCQDRPEELYPAPGMRLAPMTEIEIIIRSAIIITAVAIALSVYFQNRKARRML